MKKILFDEQGLTPGTPFTKGQWKEIVTHDENSIKGFFGEYRFLSNFWPAKVFLDGEEYACVENAYQAAKYPKEERGYFRGCEAKEAIVYTIDHPANLDGWEEVKIEVMRKLLIQKFDKELNPELCAKLLETGNKYLEETNYWQDIFWGVHVTHKNEVGNGANNLGKLIMEIRKKLMSLQ